jgi:uncharacterized protein YyaL (SSP411 family)
VDREERPDIDDIYMQATLMFNNGQGGWPMTVFLTPDGYPFHAGTYYPPQPRYGMPSFRQVMEKVLEAYRDRRDEIDQGAESISADLSRSMFDGMKSDLPSANVLDKAAANILRRVDPVHGGLSGGKPKFPHPINLEFLLRYHDATGTDQALQTVLLTLRKMGQGGMYDQLGGGFHRYSVDEKWLVPHFEKMLYDNALLSRVYLHAWQVSGDPLLREIVEDTLDYVLREMTAANGGFFSTQDADSEGEEGKYFVWTADEIRKALDGVVTNVDAVLAYWGVSNEGNFEGKNILHVSDMLERVGIRHGVLVEQMREDVSAAKMILYTLRKQRIPPGRDDKMLAAWNGMMLASFAEAARVLNRDDYRRAAVENADFLRREMMNADGRLYRTHKDGVSKINGYLEDYAHVIDGLLELYQTTFEARWFLEAQRLGDIVMTRFLAEDGGFYDTSDDHESLIVRPRNAQDNATPSGNGMIAYNFIRLTGYTGEPKYEDAATDIFRAVGPVLSEYPMAFGQVLIGLDVWLRRAVEIALVGDPGKDDMKALLNLVRRDYRPTAIVALAHTNADPTTQPPLLRTRSMREGKATAYVCENFMCLSPVTTPLALEAVLNGASVPPDESPIDSLGTSGEVSSL